MISQQEYAGSCYSAIIKSVGICHRGLDTARRHFLPCEREEAHRQSVAEAYPSVPGNAPCAIVSGKANSFLCFSLAMETSFDTIRSINIKCCVMAKQYLITSEAIWQAAGYDTFPTTYSLCSNEGLPWEFN